MLLYALYKSSLFKEDSSKTRRIKLVALALVVYAISYQSIVKLIKDTKLSSTLTRYLCCLVGADLSAALLFNYFSTPDQDRDQGEGANNRVEDMVQQRFPPVVYPPHILYPQPSETIAPSTAPPSIQTLQTLPTVSTPVSAPIPTKPTKRVAKPPPRPSSLASPSTLSLDSSNDIVLQLDDTQSLLSGETIPMYKIAPTDKIPVYKSAI